MAEHPFAAYVRILGKGPRLSRALTLDETRAAAGMILRGEVEPVQLGAFLCLLRVRTETPEEVAGFALAIRDRLPKDPARGRAGPPVDLDWPSYAGKARQLPLFLLAALLLAENGVSVALHGTEGHTAGRLYTRQALAALGIPAAGSPDEARAQLAGRRLTYLPVEAVDPRLREILDLKSLLGVRSPLNTVVRHLNPFDARTSLISVFHPNYRAVHRDAARLMGVRDLACFKGEGGEAERRPEKPCLVEGLRDGAPFGEEWPAWPAAGPRPNLGSGLGFGLGMEPGLLPALWRGDLHDPHAEATVIATAALALRQLGRADGMEQAQALATRQWQERRR